MKEFSLLPARLTPKKFNHVAEHQKLKFLPLFARNVESRKVSPTFLAKLLIYGFFAVKLPTPWTSRIHKVNAKWWLEWQIIFFILSLKDFLPVAIFHLVACKSWRIPRRRLKLLTFITTKPGRVEGGAENEALSLFFLFLFPQRIPCVCEVNTIDIEQMLWRKLWWRLSLFHPRAVLHLLNIKKRMICHLKSNKGENLCWEA